MLLQQSWQSSACTCRDVKPENLLLQTRNGTHTSPSSASSGRPLGVDDLGKGSFGVEDLHLRLIDFGSALDKHSVEELYGAEGPSEDEQTAEYAPPEALLAR